MMAISIASLTTLALAQYIAQECPDCRIPHKHQLKEAELRVRQMMET